MCGWLDKAAVGPVDVFACKCRIRDIIKSKHSDRSLDHGRVLPSQQKATAPLLGARQVRFRPPTHRQAGVPRTINDNGTPKKMRRSTRRRAWFRNKSCSRWYQHSNMQWGRWSVVYLQSPTRLSDATSTSERSPRKCNTRESTARSSTSCLSHSSNLQASISPGLFSQVFRAHAHMSTLE